MPSVLLDTSVYIAAIRSGNDYAVGLRRFSSCVPVWLSAVVLQELYAGTSQQSAHVIEDLERDFQRLDRILVPNANDWASAGKLLARLAHEMHFEAVGRSRLTSDAIIAMSAARTGTTVVTYNARDFSRLAKLRPFSWQLA